MAAKLLTVFLLALFSQGFAIPTSDVTIQDGGHDQKQLRGFPDGNIRTANILSEVMSGTSKYEISENYIFGCLPNLMLVFDAVTDMFKLYGEYQNVRKGLEEQRENCLKISNTNIREDCLKILEKEEKQAYQKITDKFRSLIKDAVTEIKRFFNCIAGLE